MGTTRIGIHEAKSRLSEYLDRAAHRGERIVVERRGQPVAALVGLDDLRRLEGPDSAQPPDGEERYAAFRRAMEAAGLITWPAGRPVQPGDYAPVEVEGQPLSEQILDERR